MPRVRKKGSATSPERTPEGDIDNCALANGVPQKECQVCKGRCPDFDRLIALGRQENVGASLDSGAQLARELEATKLEEQQTHAREALERAKQNSEKANRVTFESAKSQRREMRPDFARIVETVFVNEDLDALADRLEKALRVGEKRSERGVLEEALDEAETNWRLAARLHLTADFEGERWELENKHIHATMRDEAARSLQAEKNAGERNKQISIEDVEMRAALLFSDEWIQQELRRKRVKSTVKSLANLAEAWAQRVKTLNTLNKPR